MDIIIKIFAFIIAFIVFMVGMRAVIVGYMLRNNFHYKSLLAPIIFWFTTFGIIFSVVYLFFDDLFFIVLAAFFISLVITIFSKKTYNIF